VPPKGRDGSGDLLPGLRAALEALREAGFALGMRTGNARLLALRKMRAGGLADLLYNGGFGDRAIEREDVVRTGAIACAPAGAARASVLVGDTVRDVTAAHAADLSCLAVPTGAATAEELRAASADEVIPGLTGGSAVASLIRLAGQSARLRPWRKP
jgi:phosphoglycolate phosphatase